MRGIRLVQDRPRLFARVGDPLGSPPPGNWYFPNSPYSGGATDLGNATQRVSLYEVTAAIAIDAYGIDVGTAGEAGSVFRGCIYAENGQRYPGDLVKELPVLDTSAPVMVTATFERLALDPGFYWVGGACQLAPTTHPLIRTNANGYTSVSGYGTSVPVAATAYGGVSVNGVADAMPATFAVGGNPIVGAVPRLMFRTVA